MFAMQTEVQTRTQTLVFPSHDRVHLTTETNLCIVIVINATMVENCEQ